MLFTSVVPEVTAHRWYFQVNPLNPEERPFIDWLTFLPPNVGTKHQRAYLLKSVKQFTESRINMAAARWCCSLSSSTVINWVRSLKRLVAWMIEQNIWTFSRLDGDDILQFLQHRCYVSRSAGRKLKNASMHVDVLQWLWDLRHDYVGSLRTNPATIQHEISRIVPTDRTGTWRSVDEAIALPLIRDAVRWIQQHGDFVLHAVHSLCEAATQTVGLTRRQRGTHMREAYARLNAEPGMASLRQAMERNTEYPNRVIGNALSQTEGACFVVLFFLIGLRCQELLSWNVDAIKLDCSADGHMIYRVAGVAAKKRGASRTWVASPPIIEVIEYVTRLYAPARRATDQKALFICRKGNNAPPIGRCKRLVAASVRTRMREFANAVHRKASPQLTRLHPHMARKTFARFVVLRDKRALESLSYHFGHTHRMITDGRYVGADIELAKLLDEEGRRDLANGLADILRSGAIAGRAGNTLQALKSDAAMTSFRGRFGLQSLIDRLIEQGVQLAPCNWGYCVYSQSLSACRGDMSGPNEANRSPEICAGCANFVVTENHRAWWSDRYHGDEEFLDLANISDQSRQWVHKRMIATARVLHELNSRNHDEERSIRNEKSE